MAEKERTYSDAEVTQRLKRDLPHWHLDKGHIWPRMANPDGTFGGALASAGADRSRHWTTDDVRARMAFGLATMDWSS